MITKYETKDLRINKPVGGHQKGDVVKIRVDKKGTPKDRYWRDRVKDSEIDKCVEFANAPVEVPAEVPVEDSKADKKKAKKK